MKYLLITVSLLAGYSSALPYAKDNDSTAKSRAEDEKVVVAIGDPILHGNTTFAIGELEKFPDGQQWPRCMTLGENGEFAFAANTKEFDTAYCDGPESKFLLTFPDGVLSFQGQPLGRNISTDYTKLMLNSSIVSAATAETHDESHLADRFYIVNDQLILRSSNVSECLVATGGVLMIRPCPAGFAIGLPLYAQETFVERTELPDPTLNGTLG